MTESFTSKGLLNRGSGLTCVDGSYPSRPTVIIPLPFAFYDILNGLYVWSGSPTVLVERGYADDKFGEGTLAVSLIFHRYKNNSWMTHGVID